MDHRRHEMRNGPNNKRMRNNRNNNNNSNNNNNQNRRSQNPMTRVFESNGPDIKIRGTASHVAEKYVQLARDARTSGDPVAAENYYQHAEHYFRLIAAAQEQFRQNQPPPRDGEAAIEDGGGDESEDFSHFGAEPGFVREQPAFQPRDNQGQQQRDPQQRDQQPRDQQPRPQPSFQPQPNVPAVEAPVDRLPSFITGPQPAVNGGAFEAAPTGGERYPPRRRRRPNGPRPDGTPAPATAGEDT